MSVPSTPMKERETHGFRLNPQQWSVLSQRFLVIVPNDANPVLVACEIVVRLHGGCQLMQSCMLRSWSFERRHSLEESMEDASEGEARSVWSLNR